MTMAMAYHKVRLRFLLQLIATWNIALTFFQKLISSTRLDYNPHPYLDKLIDQVMTLKEDQRASVIVNQEDPAPVVEMHQRDTRSCTQHR